MRQTATVSTLEDLSRKIHSRRNDYSAYPVDVVICWGSESSSSFQRVMMNVRVFIFGEFYSSWIFSSVGIAGNNEWTADSL